MAEATALLAASEELGGKVAAFVAVGMFARLRTAELLQLDWRQIDLDAGTIEVASSISKTRDHRYVTISPNLAAWLRLHRRESGPLRPAAWRWHRDAAKRKAKLDKWPDNGMRHSFGSYHFARHNNAALTGGDGSPGRNSHPVRPLSGFGEAQGGGAVLENQAGRERRKHRCIRTSGGIDFGDEFG